MIRTFSSASAKLTKINLRSFELPTINSRGSPPERDASSKMRASGSANTETASSNVTPCFAQLDSAFCGSQLNRRGMLKKWYHGINLFIYSQSRPVTPLSCQCRKSFNAYQFVSALHLASGAIRGIIHAHSTHHWGL